MVSTRSAAEGMVASRVARYWPEHADLLESRLAGGARIRLRGTGSEMPSRSAATPFSRDSPGEARFALLRPKKAPEYSM